MITGRVIICAYAPEEVMYAPKPAEEQPVGDPADEQQQTKEEITEQSWAKTWSRLTMWYVGSV